MNRRARPTVVAVVVNVVLVVPFAGPTLLLAARATAATKTFHQSSARDFEEGEIRGGTILPSGEIVPGLSTRRGGLDAAFVWCSTVSRDGKTVYLGTGDDGKIFAQPTTLRAARPSGDAAEAAPAARMFARLDSPWVTAMVTRKDGQLLAATTPGGHIVVLDPADATPEGAKVRPFATVPATHIWALAHDDRSGVTYVATGLPGKVFAVDAQGRARPLWDARDPHVVSLWLEADGTLLAGTSDQAILYHVFTDGRAEALQDFDAEEVRAIARAPSGLYVAVNDFERPPAVAAAVAGAVAAMAAGKGARVTVTHPVGSPPASAGALPRPGARKSKAGLYRIDAAGRIEQVFSVADGYLTALLVHPDGSVWVASGAQGHVHRVLADGTVSMIVDVPERQVLTLTGASADVWLGTGDTAAVYVARADPGGAATYTSKVLDAEYVAAWGALEWQGSRIAFETRAGNTAKPDPGWRPWTAVVESSERAPPERDSVKDGEDNSRHIASPPARYLQYRASLRGVSPRLREVTVYFLPQNQRARVTEIALGEAAGAAPAVGGSLLASPAAATPAPGATSPGRGGRSSIVKLRWKVDNPDGDELVYRLSLRALDGSTWRPLAGMSGPTGEPLTRTEWDWNTESLPDGHYIVRVVASDERSQPAPRALSFALDSEPVRIDNRKPDILGLMIRYPTIAGRIEDSASAIVRIESAIDGGEWQLLAPLDGIADERREAFSLTLPRLARGTHAIAIRAFDSNENVGSVQVEVNAP